MNKCINFITFITTFFLVQMKVVLIVQSLLLMVKYIYQYSISYSKAQYVQARFNFDVYKPV